MNQVGIRFRDPDPVHGETKVIDLDSLLSAIRRQRIPVLLSIAISALLGLAYIVTTPKEFTAYTTVLADQKSNRIVAEISAWEDTVQDDAAILSEIEVIRSKNVAIAVTQALNLSQNAGFLNPPTSLASQVTSDIKSAIRSLLPASPSPAIPPDTSNTAALQKAAGLLQREVRVTRIGRSTALLIAYTTHDPQLSANIANAYAEAYMADQLNASFDATERTTAWLQSRLAELEANSRAAAEAVERFRSENGLTATNGRLVTEQQLAQLNIELSAALADTARATALAQQFRSAIEAEIDENLHQHILALDAEAGSRLAGYQERIAALATRLTQLEAQPDTDPEEIERASAGLSAQARAAFGEITRLAEQYANDEATMRAREEALRQSVSEATAANNNAVALQIQLRALEQRAQAVATLYQNFLTRFETIDQQKSFPISSIRLLSAADAPRSASGPSLTKTLALSLAIGLFIGAIIGTIREFRDRFLRTGLELSTETGLPFLGYLPDLSRFGQSTVLDRLLKSTAETALHSAQHPKSLYSETLRSIRMAVENSFPKANKPVIGFASALPGEGKTTLSVNFAALLAATGRSVLLLDADLRHPNLTERTQAKKGPGLFEVLTGRATLDEACREFCDKRLHVLPAISTEHLHHTSDLLASEAMGKVIDQARKIYDYVIVDLAPMGPVIDARAMARHLDRIVVVTEWGKTPRGLARQLLADDPALAEKAAGTVLNRVDIDALGRYGPMAGAERYRDAYERHYATS